MPEEGACQSLCGLAFQPPWMPARAVQCPSPHAQLQRRAAGVTGWPCGFALQVLEGRDCEEPRGAPPPPSGLPGGSGPGARGLPGDRRCQWRRTFPWAARTNAGCGGAVGGCAAGRAEEPARRNRAGDPPAFMTRGWRATSGPHYLVGGGRTWDTHPQRLPAWVPSSPRPPALSECRRKGGSDSTHASLTPYAWRICLQRSQEDGKGRFVTGDGLLPYRKL